MVCLKRDGVALCFFALWQSSIPFREYVACFIRRWVLHAIFLCAERKENPASFDRAYTIQAHGPCTKGREHGGRCYQCLVLLVSRGWLVPCTLPPGVQGIFLCAQVGTMSHCHAPLAISRTE